MADIYDAQVKLSFIVPKGETDRVKKIVSAALQGSMLGRAGGIPAMMGMGKAGMATMGAAAGVGALVVSSPMLQNTLKQIARLLTYIIRPIGDIVAVGLRPIIDILRPIGIFFRILIRPYIRKAMEAMRLGRGFMAKGEYGKAAEAYALGAAFLLKPFFDQMVTVATISVQGILWGIKMLGEGLLSVLDPIGNVREAFAETMDGAIQAVGLGGAKIIAETSIMLEQWLVTLKREYKNIENLANVSMIQTSGFVGEGFIRIIQAATNFFAPSLEHTTNTMFDNIVNYAIKKVNELNTVLNEAKLKAETFGPWTATTTVRTTTGRRGLAGVAYGLGEIGRKIYNIGDIIVTGTKDMDDIIRETGEWVAREVGH